MYSITVLIDRVDDEQIDDEVPVAPDGRVRDPDHGAQWGRSDLLVDSCEQRERLTTAWGARSQPAEISLSAAGRPKISTL